MLYRSLAALIVLFWLVMTGLLVRNHVGTGSKTLREVPLTHVVKLLFQHERPSDLQIIQDKTRLGSFHIVPHVVSDPPRRTIEFTGSIFVVLPGMPRQRLSWDGTMELAATLDITRFTIGLNFREPASYRTELEIDVGANTARYLAMIDRRIIEQQQYTLDASGARAALDRMEIDPALLNAMQKARPTTPPIVKAQQSSWQIHGEKVETYLITVEQSEQTLIELQIDQLGQIVNVKTLLGYTLEPENLDL